jgi:serine/threonine protein kinase/tetratricopeptide (TPR) repeat protein
MLKTSAPNLDDIICAYEAAQDSGQADLTDFLPPPSDPLYRQAVCELIRLDLEYGWRKGCPRSLEDYRRQFPEAFRDPTTRDPILFEDFRLRWSAGLEPDPEEYVERFGASPAVWPVPPSQFEALTPILDVKHASSVPITGPADVQTRRLEPGQVHVTDFSFSNTNLTERSSPQASVASAEADSMPALATAGRFLPDVGTEFMGFRLIDELGTGAFAKVYLAKQGDLADRYVALKVSSDIEGESQTLARLQHTNIVPIYSVHRSQLFQAVCMPYYGSATLKDVLENLRGHESLPVSGKGLTSTLNQRKSLTQPLRKFHIAEPEPASPPCEVLLKRPELVETSADSAPPLQKLEGLSYVQAILWVAARLADGLAHAHERGILHCDLKPANVLLTDEGQPMLLDFNLSQDLQRRSTNSWLALGGTLPYMAPEYLRAFQGGPCGVDGRSDVFSLGVILYEMLTARHPFPSRTGPIRDLVPQMIQDRLATPPRLCQWNRAVSPAVESIIRHCIEPDPDRRYPSARALLDDLQRHEKDEPLKFAPEPSVRERARKWARRHPRLTSAGSVAAFSIGLLAIVCTLSFMGWRQYRSLLALDSRKTFNQEKQEAQFQLYGRTANAQQLDLGLDHCQKALGVYGVLDDPKWQDRLLVTRLPEETRASVRDDVGEVLFLAARAKSLRAASEDTDTSELSSALVYNDSAISSYDQGRVPRAIWQQRADLLRLLNKTEEASEYSRKADQTPFQGARDRYLTAHVYAKEGKYRQALPLLEEATRLNPQDFSAWFVKGNCHDALLQNEEAVGCYTMCIGLRPDFHWTWFNRGWASLRRQQYQKACDDFDRVITLKPDLAQAYVNRALALQGLGAYDRAVADLTRALDLGAGKTQVYFMRALARERAGDIEGAKRDRHAGMQSEPVDEAGWVARGLARLSTDPRGALADFDQALAENPLSFAALQNKAHVLGERLARDKDAVAVLDRAVALYPDSVKPRAGRGVHLARLGKTKAALEDARVALLLDTQPPNLYQVACIYALTTPAHAENRLRALELLSLALRGGYGLHVVDSDSDLNPLRSDPDFRRLIEAAQALNRKPGGSKP